MGSSKMGDYISELPDDVVCYILCFLPLRDAVRTRLLSRRWRYLPYCRPILQFDALNVFGKESCNRVSYQSKFVRLVDQLLDTLGGPNLRALKLRFGLGNEYSSHIDCWIQRVVTMGIKELDLSASSLFDSVKSYVFSCYLLCPLMTPSLTCLRLMHCQLNLSSCCTSWISHLTTLHLSSVPMNQNDLEFLLSSALNLTSLSLEYCCFPTIECLKVELLGLKKLVIDDHLRGIKLTCPNLEVFKYTGRLRKITVAHLPFLREASVFLNYHLGSGSLIFAELIRFAPNLKALSFFVRTQVRPFPLPIRMSKPCIKQLDLLILDPFGLDVFSISYFLNACPSLEILRLKLRLVHYTSQSPQKEYPDRRHFKLKEVKIDGIYERLNSLELALYLLRNAVALEKMVIVYSGRNKEKITTLLQNVNASVEVIILHK